MLNVKDFGAIGDGVTDDTAAVQAALDEAAALGRMVFFPAGAYTVSDLTATGGPTLCGESRRASVLRYYGDGWALTMPGSLGSAGTWMGGGIERLRIDLREPAANGIRLQSVNRWAVRDVAIGGNGSTGTGLLIDVLPGLRGSAYNRIDNLYVSSCGCGLKLDAAGEWVNRNSLDAVHLQSCDVGLHMLGSNTNDMQIRTAGCRIGLLMDRGDSNVISYRGEGNSECDLWLLPQSFNNRFIGTWGKVEDEGLRNMFLGRKGLEFKVLP